MLTHEQRQRVNELERMPAGQRTAAQQRELELLRQLDFSIGFVSQDTKMPPDDDKKKGKDDDE